MFGGGSLRLRFAGVVIYADFELHVTINITTRFPITEEMQRYRDEILYDTDEL